MTTQEILEAARAARSALGLSSGEVRRAALLGMAEALCSPARQQAILEANAADRNAAFLDRAVRMAHLRGHAGPAGPDTGAHQRHGKGHPGSG